MSYKQELSKPDIARSHIENAIKTLFCERNYVISAFFLAQTAHEMLSDLLERKGIESARKLNENGHDGTEPFFTPYRIILNFSKHADRDPEDKIEFYDYFADLMILTAITDYEKLEIKTELMKIFEVYYRRVYKELEGKEASGIHDLIPHDRRNELLQLGERYLRQK